MAQAELAGSLAELRVVEPCGIPAVRHDRLVVQPHVEIAPLGRDVRPVRADVEVRHLRAGVPHQSDVPADALRRWMKPSVPGIHLVGVRDPQPFRAFVQDLGVLVHPTLRFRRPLGPNDDVVLVDPDPVGRTRRSNPVTYLKVFDEIRKVFAETRDARMRSFSATTFSFNAAQGGRCPKCRGNGTIDVDMQFLADVSMTCPECHGRRFRQDVLEVKYRGLSIADVLEMTVREAFTFFRTHRKLLKKLHFLTAVGLDYLPLGQPATTLSGGELQRLKLAVRLAGGSKSRTLFLIDEPTTGLHAADLARLLKCFAGLLSVGHSLIVIEHNLDVIKSADFVIDLGPEAGAAGGQLVAAGTPEEVAAVPASITGGYLRSVGVVPLLDEDGKFSEN